MDFKFTSANIVISAEIGGYYVVISCLVGSMSISLSIRLTLAKTRAANVHERSELQIFWQESVQARVEKI